MLLGMLKTIERVVEKRGGRRWGVWEFMRIDVGLLDAVTAWLEAVNWSGGGGWGASLLLRHLF